VSGALTRDEREELLRQIESLEATVRILRVMVERDRAPRLAAFPRRVAPPPQRREERRA